jgi:hypothetical protein
VRRGRRAERAARHHGGLQGTEAIKLILGLGDTLAGRLVCYDAIKTWFCELRLRRDPVCPPCGDGIDHSDGVGLAVVDEPEPAAVASEHGLELSPDRGKGQLDVVVAKQECQPVPRPQQVMERVEDAAVAVRARAFDDASQLAYRRRVGGRPASQLGAIRVVVLGEEVDNVAVDRARRRRRCEPGQRPSRRTRPARRKRCRSGTPAAHLRVDPQVEIGDDEQTPPPKRTANDTHLCQRYQGLAPAPVRRHLRPGASQGAPAMPP